MVHLIGTPAAVCKQDARDKGQEAKELALTEQARRNYRKVADWQEDGGVVYKIIVWQLGDIFVVAVPGEPYTELQVRCWTCQVLCNGIILNLCAVLCHGGLGTQVMIRKAVPEKHVIVSVNTNGSLTQGYILPAGICGCGAYQDKIAVVRRTRLPLLASITSNTAMHTE